MRDTHFSVKLLIVAWLTVTFVLLPGCKRAPKEEAVPIPTEVVEIPLNVIDLPQKNPEIGITLNTAPEGLVATYNGEHWIELTDKQRPRVLYTFIASAEQAPGVAPVTIADFEARILANEDGQITGGGSNDTGLGQVNWSSGSYSEDGETIEKVYLLAPHPSGAGNLILTSVCPPGTASVEERLVVMQKLLTHVS